MVKIVRLAVIALLLYVAANEAGPWLKDQLAVGSTDVESGPVRCVYLGDAANDLFGDRVGRVSGPGADPGVWEAFLGETRGRIGDAQRECRCSQLSCRKTLEAMTKLEDMLNELDVRFRGGVMERNPVSRQLEINELLNEARVLARDGK